MSSSRFIRGVTAPATLHMGGKEYVVIPRERYADLLQSQINEGAFATALEELKERLPDKSKGGA